MKTFEKYVSEWEKNAEKDAYWAVLTSSQYEKREWNKQKFFDTGIQEISQLKGYIEKMQLPIPFQGTALDFGCGTGRLSRALGHFFSEVYGIDISANMIREAKKVSSSMHVKFMHNPHPNLQLFESEKFDFIYSNIVLQHIARRDQATYLSEFARLIKIGGWITVQIPSKRFFSSLLGKIKGKILERLPYRMKKQILVHLLKNQTRALRDFDFEINVCPEKVIRQFALKNHLDVKHVAYTNSCESDFCGNLTFNSYDAVKEMPGYLSPMYFMQKLR